MEFNILYFMWLSYSFIVTFGGLCVLYAKNVPIILVRLYTFGKVNKNMRQKKNFTQWLEVPKRWFSHFYVFASLYMSFILATVCGKYFYNHTNPFITDVLDFCGSTNRQGFVKPESVIILTILVTLQVFRRFYECFYVAVYSDCKMNLSHYIVGYTFYFGVGLSLIHDAPGFEHFTNNAKESYNLGEWFTPAHCIGTVLFFLAFLLQFETHKAFSSLRKSGDKIVSTEHHMPSSGFFEYVSCPHYFAEIVMYMSGCLILEGKSISWWLVCLWVLSNQIMTALMSHQWYRETFKKYPKNRKAVIPFLI